VTIADMCAYGMKQKDKDGEGLIQKTTKFMTNSSEVAKELERQCPNREGRKSHRHIELIGGNRSKKAPIYPPGLCKAICTGLKHQKD